MWTMKLAYCAVYNYESKRNEVVLSRDIYLRDSDGNFTVPATTATIKEAKNTYGHNSARLKQAHKIIAISILTNPCK